MVANEGAIHGIVETIARAQRAFVEGDSTPYEELFEHTQDATLTGPFGGPTIRGWEAIRPLMRRAAAFFEPPADDSTVLLECATDLGSALLLRLTERNRVRFKGSGDIVDWNLRVSLILRETVGRWRILHRHADPLIQIDTSRPRR